MFVGLSLASKNVGWVQFDLMQYGGTKQGLGLDDVRSVLVALPDTAEQQRTTQSLTCDLEAFRLHKHRPFRSPDLEGNFFGCQLSAISGQLFFWESLL